MRNEFETYIRLLVNKKSSISEEKQTEIIEFLFDTFVQYNKDLLMISDGYISPIRSRVAFETLANMQLQMQFPDIKVKSYNEEKKSYKWNLKISDIFDTITTVNTYALLKYESDLFAPKQVIVKNPRASTITVITNRLHMKEPTTSTELTEEEENAYIAIVDDYKNHFPDFDSLLKLIIDMRFAKNRKGSFVHFRAKSNWGKSFLSGLLKNIEIGFEIDYHNLMNKGANDIAPVQLNLYRMLYLNMESFLSI
ncbi:MAG: hypothetical protein KAG56_11480 [Sulfurovaceae bacterium]|nr:hypothetical protein [Sulfurovaceae bacterium]